MFCPKCGTSQVEGVTHCVVCGAVIPPPAPRTNPLDKPAPTQPNEQKTVPMVPPSEQPTVDMTKIYPGAAPSPPPAAPGSPYGATIAAPMPGVTPYGVPPPPGPPPPPPPSANPYAPPGPSNAPYAVPYSPYSQSPSPGSMPGGYGYGANMPGGMQSPGMQPGMSGYPPYGYQPSSATQGANPRAIVGMVLSLVAFITCWIGILFSIGGTIVSKIELDAIRRGESSRAGETFAKVGFIVGLIHIGLFALMFVIGFLSAVIR